MNAETTSNTAPPITLHQKSQAHAGFSARNAPMLMAAACFAAGIAIDEWRALPIAALAVSAFALGIAAMLLARRWLRTSLLLVCMMWLALGWLAALLGPDNTGNQQAAMQKYTDGLSRHFIGTIERITPVANDENSDGAVMLDVHLREIEDVTPQGAQMVPTQSGVRMYVRDEDAETTPWHCGEVISAEAILHAPEKFLDPGAWDYAAYLAQNGIGARTTVHVGAIHVESAPSKLSALCRMRAMQTWAAEKLNDYSASRANTVLPRQLRIRSGDDGALAAMLFGDRTRLDRMLKQNFVSTGSFHFFVVSGLHVGIIAALIYWILRRMHFGKATSLLLMLALTTAYAVMTGFGQPVQRALWMTAIFAVAQLLWRKTPMLNVIGITALVMLTVTPHLLYDAGFQMTVLAVLAIAGIAVPLCEATFVGYAKAAKMLYAEEFDPSFAPKLMEFRVLLRLVEQHTARAFGKHARRVPSLLVIVGLWALELFIISIIVEMVMTLPMALWFHRVPLPALPANMVCLPMLLLIVPLGLLGFLASLLSPWLALLPMGLVAALLHFAEWFADQLAHAHIGHAFFGEVRTPAPEGPAILLAITLLALAIFFAGRKKFGVQLLSIAMLAAFIAASLWPTPMHRAPGLLEVTVIDVGQGDSILAVTPDGKTLLVDAGGPIGGPFLHTSADASTAFDIGEEVVSPYLWQRQLRRLDAVAVTHPHSDHMGGMPAVLRNFHPRELWLGSTLDAPEEHELLATAAALGIPVKHFSAGDTTHLGATPIRLLWPPAQFAAEGRGADRQANNDSLVMELDNGASSALLEGDAEAPSEAGMIAAGTLRPVTVLKVAHHGSKTSSTESFLTAVHPTDAIISAGRENPFGHPKLAVVNALAAHGATVYRTDREGAVTILMDDAGHASVKTFVAQSP